MPSLIQAHWIQSQRQRRKRDDGHWNPLVWLVERKEWEKGGYHCHSNEDPIETQWTLWHRVTRVQVGTEFRAWGTGYQNSIDVQFDPSPLDPESTAKEAR